MKIICIEETPNPNARKFIVDEPAKQEMSFFNADAAKGYELAEKLFAIPGISTLLFLGDFITVNKAASAKWPDLVKEVGRVLENA